MLCLKRAALLSVMKPHLRLMWNLLKRQTNETCHFRDPPRVLDHGPVPAEFAIRGFYGATLSEEGYERTHGLLTKTLGFQFIKESGNRFRYQTGEKESSGWNRRVRRLNRFCRLLSYPWARREND